MTYSTDDMERIVDLLSVNGRDEDLDKLILERDHLFIDELKILNGYNTEMECTNGGAWLKRDPIEKDDKGFPIKKNFIDADLHLKQNRMHLPSIPLHTNILLHLFETGMQKTGGEEHVIGQSKINLLHELVDADMKISQTIIKYDGVKTNPIPFMIHYPFVSDMKEHIDLQGLVKHYNSGHHDYSNFPREFLESDQNTSFTLDMLMGDNKHRKFAKDMTGVSDLSRLTKLGEYLGKDFTFSLMNKKFSGIAVVGGGFGAAGWIHPSEVSEFYGVRLDVYHNSREHFKYEPETRK